jgi:hypothetical protein
MTSDEAVKRIQELRPHVLPAGVLTAKAEGKFLRLEGTLVCKIPGHRVIRTMPDGVQVCDFRYDPPLKDAVDAVGVLFASEFPPD